MATRGTGKTLEQIEKEQLEKEMKPVNQAVATAEKDSADYLKKYNATVDNQVATVTNRYQQDIDGADEEYREQFDANAIAELVNRKKVEEHMANMGLTDSGLNRTQQTALSVQKGNADAATRRDKLEYVQELENLINKAVADGEATKAGEANKQNASLAAWKNDLILETQQNAAKNALKLFNTQEAALDAEYVANISSEQNQNSQNYKYDQLAGRYKQLQEDYDALEEKYENYISPEELEAINKAKNSANVRAFNAAILTPQEFSSRRGKTTIDGKTRAFDNRQQYIDAVLKDWYENRQLTENEVVFLKSEYGLK